ncbi:MAG TPA: ribosomal protein S18-alanine N-acetyltransferase [Longimicrobiaceae bacterium]|nr:ribosomal protein S18-alanine N-acetyltransferase [Longimicrobiaceae bacterium]
MKLGGEVPRAGGAAFWLRPLLEADLDRVMEIERDCFSTPWKDSTFRGLLRRADTDLVGAEDDARRLVGYAVAWTVVDQSELGNVAVAEEARGAGIGRALVEAIVERVRARGSRECFLEVRESNAVAQGLYDDMGFEVVGRRRAYYALPTEDALVMRLFV